MPERRAGKTLLSGHIHIFPNPPLALLQDEKLPDPTPELGVPGWVGRVEGGVAKTLPPIRALHL